MKLVGFDRLRNLPICTSMQNEYSPISSGYNDNPYEYDKANTLLELGLIPKPASSPYYESGKKYLLW